MAGYRTGSVLVFPENSGPRCGLQVRHGPSSRVAVALIAFLAYGMLCLSRVTWGRRRARAPGRPQKADCRLLGGRVAVGVPSLPEWEGPSESAKADGLARRPELQMEGFRHHLSKMTRSADVSHRALSRVQPMAACRRGPIFLDAVRSANRQTRGRRQMAWRRQISQEDPARLAAPEISLGYPSNSGSPSLRRSP